MTTTKQIALCDNLNMNFDEATELFSPESLESMQIAKINGGVPIPVLGIITTIAAIFTIAAGTIAVIEYFSGTEGPTKQNVSDVDIETSDGTRIKVTCVRYSDTVKIVFKDSTQMWFSITPGATPTK